MESPVTSKTFFYCIIWKKKGSAIEPAELDNIWLFRATRTFLLPALMVIDALRSLEALRPRPFEPPRAYHMLTFLRFQKTGVVKTPENPILAAVRTSRRHSCIFLLRNVPISADWRLNSVLGWCICKYLGRIQTRKGEICPDIRPYIRVLCRRGVDRKTWRFFIHRGKSDSLR